MKQRMDIATTLCQMQLVIKITTMYLCTGFPGMLNQTVRVLVSLAKSHWEVQSGAP